MNPNPKETEVGCPSSETSTSEINPFPSIQLGLLEMTDPYYPHSKLSKSIFHGYYVLFFMFSVFFLVTYPVLNYIENRDLFGITIIKLVQANLKWDAISAALFLFMALLFIQLSMLLPKFVAKSLSVGVFGLFISCGLYIINTYDMYFSDRIFIVVLNWALCFKTISYILDRAAISQISDQEKPLDSWAELEKQKSMQLLSKKLLYLLSPYPCYKKFVAEHDPTLKVHSRYLLTKFLVSFLCLFANNTLIVKFIQPACEDQSLSFIALTFKLIPLTFYINMLLYYMVMDNVIAALCQLTRIRDRVLYLDWWNAETLFEFLDRWCLIVNMTTEGLAPSMSLRGRHTLHVIILQSLMMTIFGRSLSGIGLASLLVTLVLVFALGGNRRIQNNMITHILWMTFTPVLIAMQWIIFALIVYQNIFHFCRKTHD